MRGIGPIRVEFECQKRRISRLEALPFRSCYRANGATLSGEQVQDGPELQNGQGQGGPSAKGLNCLHVCVHERQGPRSGESRARAQGQGYASGHGTRGTRAPRDTGQGPGHGPRPWPRPGTRAPPGPGARERAAGRAGAPSAPELGSA